VIFLVDAQLPPALARALSDLGHEATQRNAVVITKDEDFVGHGRFGAPAPPVVWIRLGNVSRRVLLSRFLPLLPQVVQLVEAGERVVEIRAS